MFDNLIQDCKKGSLLFLKIAVDAFPFSYFS